MSDHISINTSENQQPNLNGLSMLRDEIDDYRYPLSDSLREANSTSFTNRAEKLKAIDYAEYLHNRFMAFLPFVERKVGWTIQFLRHDKAKRPGDDERREKMFGSLEEKVFGELIGNFKRLLERAGEVIPELRKIAENEENWEKQLELKLEEFAGKEL